MQTPLLLASRRPSYAFTLLLALLLTVFYSAGAIAQTVTSDKDDYAPGEVATITGSGWAQDQMVHVEFKEEPDYPDYHIFDVAVDADGEWVIKYNIEQRHLGVKFTVSAVGRQSGVIASHQFTDAGAYPSGISLRDAATKSICFGAQSPTLIADLATCGTGSKAAIEYKWFYNTTNSTNITTATPVQTTSTTANTTSNSFNATTSVAGTRYYFCQVRQTSTLSGDASGCGNTFVAFTTGSTVAVTVNSAVGTPTSILVATGSSEPTCQIEAATTTTYITTATNSTGYNWSLSNSNAGSINSAGVVTWASGFSGQVDIQVTANGCNGPSTQVIRNVTLNARPTVTITGAKSFCSGGSTTLVAEVSAGGGTSTSYQWYKNGEVINGVAAQRANYNVSSVGTYSVMVTNNSRCSTTTQGIQVTEAPKPALTISNPVAVCAPTTIDLTASAVTSGSTLPTGTVLSYWTNAAATTPVSNPAAIAVGGTYYIKASSINCDDVKAVIVSITPAPTTAAAGTDQTIPSTSATLAGNTPSVGSGTWSIISAIGDNITSGAFGNASSPTSTFTGTAGTSYTLRWTVANGTCTSSDDVVIFFNQRITALRVASATGIYGGKITLEALLTTGGTGVSNKTVSFKLNGSEVGTAITDGTGLATLPNVSLAGINASTTSYEGYVVASFVAEPGYASSSGTNNLTVNRSANSITFAALTSKTYGDVPFVLSATATSGLPVSFAVGGPASYEASTGKLTITGAGLVTVTASQAVSENYVAATNVVHNFTVEQALLTITAQNQEKTYGEAVAFAGTEFKTSALAYGETVSSVTLTSSGANKTAPVSTYAITPSGPVGSGTFKASNYIITYAAGTLTVGQATPTVDLAIGGPYPYDAKAHSASATVTGVNGDVLTAALTYNDDVTVPVNAGSYAVKASFAGNTNYKAATDATGELIIDKADAKIGVVGYSGTYDAQAHGATGTTMGVGGVSLPGLNLGASFINAPGGTADWTFTGGTNYKDQSGHVAIVINQATPKVTAIGGDFTYTGDPQEGSATATGIGSPAEDLTDGLTLNYSGETNGGVAYNSSTAPTAAGEYMVTATYAPTTNYAGATDSQPLNIGRAAAVVKAFAAADLTYNATAKMGTGTATGVKAETLLPVSLSYVGTGTTNYPASTTAPTNAGDYTITASYAQSDNYSAVTGTPVAFTIGKANAVVSVAGYSGPYDGLAHGATGTARGAKDVDMSSLLSLGATFTNAPGGKASWTFKGGDNYNDQDGEVAIAISKIASAIDVTVGGPYTYDGKAKAISSAIVTGLAGASLGNATVVYKQGSTEVAAPTNAGNYTVYASYAGNENYLPAFDNSNVLTIDRALPSVTAYAPTNLGYNASPKAGSGIAKGVDDVLLSPAVTLSYAGVSPTVYGSTTPPTNAGSYTVTAAFAGNSNYQDASSSSVEFTVTPATPVVTITDGSFTYNAEKHPATGVSVTGSSPDVLSITSILYEGINGTTYASSAEAPTGAGEYRATARFAGNSNYTATSNTATIQISKANPVVTLAVGSTYIYNGLAQGATVASIKGVENEELGTVTYSGVAPTSYSGGIAPTNAGSYNVKVAFNGSANYFGTTDNKNFSIDRAMPKVTAEGGVFVYDASPKAGSGSVTGIGDVALEPAVTLNYAGVSPTVYGSTTPPTNAGSYTVTAAFAGNSNYKGASSSPIELSIGQAVPTVVLTTGGPYTYDGKTHLASATVTGVPGEKAALNTTVSYKIAAATVISPINAGSYDVTVSFAATTNYKAVTELGTLVINKATPTVTVKGGSFVYNGTPQGGTGSATGVNGINDALSPVVGLSYSGTDKGKGSYGPTDLAPSKAGSYTVVASFAGNSNYEKGQSEPAELVIDQATPKVELTLAASYTYTGQPQGVKTATVTGIGGATLGAVITYAGVSPTSYSLSSTAPTNAGTYKVTVAFDGKDTNYGPASTSQQFVINKAKPTVVAEGGTFIYNGKAQSGKGSATGIAGALYPAITLSYSGKAKDEEIYGPTSGAPTKAGTYAVVALFEGNENYEKCQSASATLTINQAPLVITANTVSDVQYSDIVPAFEVTYAGFVNDETVANLGGKLEFATSATLTPTRAVASPMGTYSIVPSGLTSFNYKVSFVAGSFKVTPETDVKAYYTGALFASTSGTNTSSAVITLSATIKDLATDGSGGNIQNATVSFINRDNNTVLKSGIPLGLVTATDLTTGTATWNWTVDIQNANSQSFTIGVIVDGYYTRNVSADNEVVTVSKPLSDFITGGGYLMLTSSSGLNGGDNTPSSRNNFGFNVKYNKSGTNLQGNINTIIRRTEGGKLRVYQVKGNSMTSMAVDASITTKHPYPTATFNGKANIQDITDPSNVVPVDGNATLQVTMTDKGDPGVSDQIAITVWNKAGGLWYASNWDNTKTIEQVLAGGNLKVSTNSSFSSGTTSTITATSTSKITVLGTDPNASAVKDASNLLEVYPMPLIDRGTVHFRAQKAGKVQVVVFDGLGRQVATLYDGVVEAGEEQNVEFNRKNLPNGFYFLRMLTDGKVENKRITIAN